MELPHVLVVGAGQMGSGIAQVVAASGRRVSLHDSFPGATDRARQTMRRSLEKLAAKGGPDPDETLERITAVDELVPADLMIEAVVEDPAVKGEVFRRADERLPRGAILASNTSSIPIATLAAATSRAKAPSIASIAGAAQSNIAVKSVPITSMKISVPENGCVNTRSMARVRSRCVAGARVRMGQPMCH